MSLPLSGTFPSRTGVNVSERTIQGRDWGRSVTHSDEGARGGLVQVPS